MTREMEVYLTALLKLVDNAPEGLDLLILAHTEEGLHTLQNCCHECSDAMLAFAYDLRGRNIPPDETELTHRGTETVQ
jgi:hypothetical protein